MRVVHLSTTDFGGAYKAAERISASMESVGIDSKVLVRTKSREDTVGIEIIHNPIKKIISKAKNVGNLLFSEGEIISDYFGTDITQNMYVQEADVIFLHWVNSFISYRNVEQLLQMNKKLIWVMHDMWLFTGGCHCDQYCGKYEGGCGKCPLIGSQKLEDISYKNYHRKLKMLNDGQISLVGPSKWLVQCAKKSKITNNNSIYCIPNPIDDKIFYPKKETKKLREKYGIPLDKHVVMFGAMKAEQDRNKGIQYLKKAIKRLPSEEYVAVIFGNENSIISEEHAIQIYSMGKIQEEEKMAELYNCADVFVAPSLQESFGYTVCEALSCGIPVVAFPVGGIIDQIEHRKNGYLAKYQDEEDIIRGIRWAVETRNEKNINLNILTNNYKEIGKKYLEICGQVIIQNKN